MTRPDLPGISEKHCRPAGCRLEFALRDIYTLCGEPWRIRRAVEIIRNEIEGLWGK